MSEHYCHNCRNWDKRPDGTHCGFCLEFWADNRRMPVPGDALPRKDAFARAYREMGWELPS